MAGLTISSTRVPYDESIGDFVARNKFNTLTRVGNDDTLTSQHNYTGIHRDIVGTNFRVDTLMALVIAEDADGEEGW